MKRLTAGIAIMLIVVFGMLSVGTAHAKKDKKAKKDKVSTYEVTITNITRGQIISPPIVISHNKDFQLFSLGKSASPGLALLAEEGMPTDLETELSGMDSVFQFYTAEPPDNFILPGKSVTVEIETQKDFRFLSAAGMLVSTNDAFFAVRGVEVHKKDGMIMEARAYDAGSEFNSEMCAYIPGPPCGKHVHDDKGLPEGYVYIHSGIHGIADLEPADFDWRNPVATVTVQKVK